MISPDELAWGDLSRYDVIMTGVRAYERRADLRAYNQRLLDYARAGGTVIVQYNKFEFNDAQYGPYPAKVGRERVTDENAELKLLAPTAPGVQRAQPDWPRRLDRMGAGARAVFPRRNQPRSAIHRISSSSLTRSPTTRA